MTDEKPDRGVMVTKKNADVALFKETGRKFQICAELARNCADAVRFNRPESIDEHKLRLMAAIEQMNSTLRKLFPEPPKEAKELVAKLDLAREQGMAQSLQSMRDFHAVVSVRPTFWQRIKLAWRVVRTGEVTSC